MENFWTVYLLSVLDNLLFIRPLFIAVGLIALAALAVSTLVASITPLYPPVHRTPEHDAAFKELRKLFKTVVIVSAVLVCVLSLVPTRRAIVEAYVMVEGSRLLTADNAEKLTTEITKRYDTLINRIFSDAK